MTAGVSMPEAASGTPAGGRPAGTAWRGLVHMVRKELLQLLRDRKMIPVLLLGPLFQLLALGFAANNDVTLVPLLVVDLDRSPASRDLVSRFTSSGSFDLAAVRESSDAIEAEREKA